MNEKQPQNEEFPVGKYLKVFMKNGFKFEGKILRSNNLIVKIHDNPEPRHLLIADMSNFIVNEVLR